LGLPLGLPLTHDQSILPSLSRAAPLNTVVGGISLGSFRVAPLNTVVGGIPLGSFRVAPLNTVVQGISLSSFRAAPFEGIPLSSFGVMPFESITCYTPESLPFQCISLVMIAYLNHVCDLSRIHSSPSTSSLFFGYPGCSESIWSIESYLSPGYAFSTVDFLPFLNHPYFTGVVKVIRIILQYICSVIHFKSEWLDQMMILNTECTYVYLGICLSQKKNYGSIGLLDSVPQFICAE